MAPKSAAALVLLAAMIAGLAPMIAGLAPQLQAQLDAFFSVVDNVCSGNGALKSCARLLLVGAGDATIPPYCCSDLRKALSSSISTPCACRFGKEAADILGVDVDRRCQAVADGPSDLMEYCMMVKQYLSPMGMW